MTSQTSSSLWMMSNSLKNTFHKISYDGLNARQQENYNFHKIAAKLADYGFTSIKLSDDWQGADFIACHCNGLDSIKVQLKGRVTIDKKYLDKDIYIGFIHEDKYYVFPHDVIVREVLATSNVEATKSWQERGVYNWPQPTKWLHDIIKEYEL